jgi:hypothetical protein
MQHEGRGGARGACGRLRDVLFDTARPAAACAPALQDMGGDLVRVQSAHILKTRAAGTSCGGRCATLRLAWRRRMRALPHLCS